MKFGVTLKDKHTLTHNNRKEFYSFRDKKNGPHSYLIARDFHGQAMKERRNFSNELSSNLIVMGQ